MHSIPNARCFGQWLTAPMVAVPRVAEKFSATRFLFIKNSRFIGRARDYRVHPFSCLYARVLSWWTQSSTRYRNWDNVWLS
jgi:hypothetical protein